MHRLNLISRSVVVVVVVMCEGARCVLVRRHVRYGASGFDSVFRAAQSGGQRVHGVAQLEQCLDATSQRLDVCFKSQPSRRPQFDPHQCALATANNIKVLYLN